MMIAGRNPASKTWPEDRSVHEVFVTACQAIVDDPNTDVYAKSYAKGGLELASGNTPFDFNGHSIRTQIIYIKNNISTWRGEKARETKNDLKNVLKTIKSNPDNYRY